MYRSTYRFELAIWQHWEVAVTVYEITARKDVPPSPHKPKSAQTPQARRRERETDFERNLRDIAAKKRALKPKSPQ